MKPKTSTPRPVHKIPPKTMAPKTGPHPLLKRWPQIVGAAAVLVLLVVAVRVFIPAGQPSNFGKNELWLLTQETVQGELRLSEEQLAKIAKLDVNKLAALSWENTHHLSQYNKEKIADQQDLAAEKALPWILDADQLKRLRQIYLQQRGRNAWNDREVANELKITSQQKDELKALQDKQQKEMRSLFRPPGAGANPDQAPPPVTREQVEELRKTYETQINGVLAPEQHETWVQMLGPPFKGPVAPLPRGGGWGGPMGGP
jgi:hypothetical protein